MIHSVRKKAFKALSKIMYSKKLEGSLCLRVLYTKHATTFLFLLKETEGTPKRRLSSPLTSSRNSKQT